MNSLVAYSVFISSLAKTRIHLRFTLGLTAVYLPLLLPERCLSPKAGGTGSGSRPAPARGPAGTAVTDPPLAIFGIFNPRLAALFFPLLRPCGKVEGPTAGTAQ